MKAHYFLKIKEKRGAMTLPKICILFAFSFFIQTSGIAQSTISGDSLINHPGTSFPTITPSITGSSITFGNSPTADEVLMNIPLIPVGLLSAGSDVTYRIRLYMKRISNDNDPIMAFTDGNGTDFAGFLANDGSNHFKLDGTIAGTSLLVNYTNGLTCGGSCGTNLNDNYICDLTFKITSGAVTTIDTTIQGTNTQASNYSYTQTFDPSTGINFILGKQTASENYQIDSVTFNYIDALPLITSVSADTTICEGDSITFTIQDNGGTGYQWQFNGVNISGATSSSFLINPTTILDTGSYTCIVSNSNGTDTSSVILLSIYQGPTAAFTFITNQDSIMFTSTGTNAMSWSWDFGDGDTSSLENPFHLYQNSTTYYPCLTVADSIGCQNTQSTFCDSVQIIILDINEYGGLKNFSISPNPAHTNINVSFDVKSVSNIELEIVNISGKIVWNEFERRSNQNTRLINIESLPAGIYFLRLRTESTNLVKKFVIKK